MNVRLEFEKHFPVPKGVYWDSWDHEDGQYEAETENKERQADLQQARFQGWVAAISETAKP